MASRHAHPAAALPEPLRIEYLGALASLVLADGTRHPEEQGRLRQLCSALGLPPAAWATVEGAMAAPNFARIEESLRIFKADESLRFRLMLDAMVVAFADGKLDPSESLELAGFASVLGFTGEQVLTLARYVEATLGKPGASVTGPSLTATLESGLEGIPVEPGSARAAIRWLHKTLGPAPGAPKATRARPRAASAKPARAKPKATPAKPGARRAKPKPAAARPPRRD